MTLSIKIFPDKKTIQVESGARILDCFIASRNKYGKSLVAARMDNVFCSLMDTVAVDCELRPIHCDETPGARIYRNSLIFLFEYAVNQHFANRHIVLGHSLGHGFFYRSRDEGPSLTKIDTKKIEQTMRNLSGQDLRIVPGRISWKDAVECFERRQCWSALRLLQDLNDFPIRIWRCGSHIALRHSPLVKSTGVLTTFAVEPYEDGLLLRYPQSHLPYTLSERDDEPNLYSVYEEHKRWGDILGVPNVASLNALSRNRREAREYILTAEALHDRKIAEVAGMITESRGIRAVMIAGPSSSGKTTFAKKLALSLKSSGFHPELISLDDYYREKKDIPRDEGNEPDLEALTALDIPLFNKHLIKLLAGEETKIPIFDFNKAGGRLPKGRSIRIDKNGVLLFEGIHALNSNLTPRLGKDRIFRIYISAFTSLNIEDHVRIPTTDNRLIRRIVRDHQFRQYRAIDTLKIWPSVRRGEKKHIFPWQGTADVLFNSALDYELAVLKGFAEPLLRTVPPSEDEYGEARRLMDLLRSFSPFPVEEVPQFSILREFIGRSGFRY